MFQPLNSTPSMKTFPKGFIAPLLLALIAILILGGGAYVYVQNKQVTQPAVVKQTTQATSTGQIAKLQANTASDSNRWTLVSKKDFSFEYPATIFTKVSNFVDLDGAEWWSGSGKNGEFSVKIIKNTFDRDKIRYKGNIQHTTEVYLGQKQAYKYQAGDCVSVISSALGEIETIEVTFVHCGGGYSSLVGAKELEAQLLSRFKFNK